MHRAQDGGADPGKAVVVMRIDDPAFQDFREDASCLIRPQSLIGEKFVECEPTQPHAASSEPPPPLERIPDVKLGPDLNWLIRGGVDPVRFIHEYGSRIVFLHLRDQKADGTWSEAMGEGTTDFKAIGKALHDVHFAGHAIIELAHESSFIPTRPIRESLKMSREFVRQTLGY